MAVYKLGFDQVARVAHVTTGALPGGVQNLGTFEHEESKHDTYPVAPAKPHDNHTIFHHVQARLYQIGQQNMQEVEIRVVDPIAA